MSRYETLVVKQPKKYDESYIGKIYLDDKKTPVKFSFQNVKVVSIKNCSEFKNVIIKLDKSQIKEVLQVEEILMNIAKLNVSKWFSNKVKPTLIDEYFQSNIIVHKDFGNAFKARTDETEFTENNVYNINVRLVSIRFFKQALSLIWSIETFTSKDCYLFSTEEDIEDDEDCIPDINIIREEVLESLCKKLETYIIQLEELTNTTEFIKSKIDIIKKTELLSDIEEAVKNIDFVQNQK